jgi:hypothetical protein
MNIKDVTANLDLRIYTPPSAWEKMRTLPTSAELIVTLIEDNFENPPDKTAATSNKIDIIT